METSVLKKRRFGRTGMYVTPIGLGGAWLGYTGAELDEELAIDTVIRALELGVNLIDTSPMYLRRKSEEFIGKALEQWYKRGGKREDIVLTTKTGRYGRGVSDYTAEGTIRSVAKSMELLKTDYLDVLLVHDPRDLGPVLSPGGALEALKELKAQGVIRAIGLGVRDHAFHRQCMETGAFDVSLTFGDYNLLHQSAAEGVLPTAQKYNIGVLNGSPTANGLLGGDDPLELIRKFRQNGRRYPHLDDARVARARALWEWAGDQGVSLLALNLQFCRREPRIAATLVGASEPSQIEADVAALSEVITEEAWEAVHHKWGLG